MYGFSSKLHLKRFFSSTLGFHESTCTHRKSLTHKTDLYWITVSQALLLLLSEQVERLINDYHAYRDDELNEIRARKGSHVISDSPVGFVSILWMRRGSFLKAKRSFHLFCISYLWGQCAGCLIGSVLPGAWRPVYVGMVSVDILSTPLNSGHESESQNLQDPDEDRGPFSALCFWTTFACEGKSIIITLLFISKSQTTSTAHLIHENNLSQSFHDTLSR